MRPAHAGLLDELKGYLTPSQSSMWTPAGIREGARPNSTNAHPLLAMQEASRQLAAAAGSHPSLRSLDLSGTGLSDSSLSSLTGQGSSKWRWQQQQRACQQLHELHLASNSLLTGAAVAQLGKLLAAGSLGALRVLDLANCPGVGDAGKVSRKVQMLIAGKAFGPEPRIFGAMINRAVAGLNICVMARSVCRLDILLLLTQGVARGGAAGAVPLASCLSCPQCRLEVLDLSGCEVTDDGAAALAAAVGAAGSVSSVEHCESGNNHSHTRNSYLRQLKLADNNITGAGEKAHAFCAVCTACVCRHSSIPFQRRLKA